MSQTIMASAIFIFCYILIATDKGHRTVVALAGAMVMLLLNVIDQNSAFRAIDLNTIFLLVGMMTIVNITKTTGLFQYLAVKSAKVTRGNPMMILILFSVITAVLSAFLDNVTTIMLIAPVTLVIVDSLGLHPVPFLISEVVASNMGGVATLIGDPPNIMIGSAAGLGFSSFAANLIPVVILCLMAFVLTVRFLFAKELHVFPELKEMLISMDERKAITDKGLLRKSLFVIGLVMFCFLFHERWGIQPATIALSGALLLLILAKSDPEEVFMKVDWSIIFFFIGVFILVGAIEKVGVMNMLSYKLLSATKGNAVMTSMVVLWFSTLSSGIFDNIPFTAMMIPLVKQLGAHVPIAPLWWSLALGSGFGGNATLIGSSANIVVVSILNKEGYPIKFKSFLKYGIIFVTETLIISSAYVYLRYLR